MCFHFLAEMRSLHTRSVVNNDDPRNYEECRYVLLMPCPTAQHPCSLLGNTINVVPPMAPFRVVRYRLGGTEMPRLLAACARARYSARRPLAVCPPILH